MQNSPYLGRHIAVDPPLPNGKWRVGPPGLYGVGGSALDLRIGALAKYPYDSEEERAAALRELQEQWAQHSLLLFRLIEVLDPVIEHFYGPLPPTADTPARRQLLARQAVLCRAWLDFVERYVDVQVEQPFAPLHHCADEPWYWLGVLLTLLAVGLGLCSLGCLVLAATRLHLARLALYPFSLRLAAGIIVGLIALSGLREQTVDFALHAFGGAGRPYQLWSSLVVLGVCLVAAWLYTFSDAYSRLGSSPLAGRRTWLVFAFGWSQATIFAALASWLGAGRLFPLGNGPPSPARVLPLPFGMLYLDYIITAGILALVVGVFTQILWEDKSVTEPL